MLVTLLATIGLFFIITLAYKRGKSNGIHESVEFFLAEMERRRIEVDLVNEPIPAASGALRIQNTIRRLIGRKTNGRNE